MIPEPAIDGFLSIRCDDVFDPSPHHENFMDKIVRHYAPVIDYNVLNEFVDKVINELKETTFGESDLLPEGTNIHNSSLAKISVHRSTTLTYKMMPISLLLVAKAMKRSLCHHYDNLYELGFHKGIEVWEEHGSNLDIFKNMLFATPPNFSLHTQGNLENLEAVLAWRFLPIFEAIVFMMRFAINIPTMNCFADARLINFQGVFNFFANHLSSYPMFHHLEACKYAVIAYFDHRSFYAEEVFVPKELDPRYHESIPDGQYIPRMRDRFTYTDTVHTVEHLRKVYALKMIEFIHMNRYQATSINCHFRLLSDDLMVSVGVYLTGEEFKKHLYKCLLRSTN